MIVDIPPEAIKEIPLSFRFAILVARRVYRKIGYKILDKKNMENYKKSGKIYVSNFEKIIETFLSVFDLFQLLLMNKNNFLRIKFNDAGDESLSHTLKAYNLIDKLLEKTDHKYAYDIDVKDIKGNTVVDISMKSTISIVPDSFR